MSLKWRTLGATAEQLELMVNLVATQLTVE